MTGKLVIVPTPIGNLGDMTVRAFEELRGADVVCCEDTRVTAKLLVALGIEGKRLERLDEHTMAVRAPQVIARVQAGDTVAYCSDAGMPGVSDPGLRLVRAARDADVTVDVLPGPTAVATAYVASGAEGTGFYFGGFFPRKDEARRRLLEQLKPLDAALVFYESPRRIVASLASVAAVMPRREVVVCRELTKLHEEVLRGTAARIADELSSRESIKGEIAVVIGASNPSERADSLEAVSAAAQWRAQELLEQGGHAKTVAKQLMEEFGIARNAAYDIVYMERGRS